MFGDVFLSKGDDPIVGEQECVAFLLLLSSL